MACRISTLRSWTRSTGTVLASTICWAVSRVSRKNTRTRHSLPRGDGGPQQGVLGALGLFLALLEGQIVCGVHQSPISML